MTERAGEAIQGTGKALKRRGLIAAAAALVAGMVAKRAAEDAPVAANDAIWTLPYTGTTVGAGTTGAAFSITNTSYGYGIYGRGYFNHAIFGDLFAAGNSKAAVYGVGNSTGTYGVLGDGYDGSGIGVQGVSNAAAGTGVKGVSASGFPVIGVATWGTNANAGVLGVGTSGPGMQGQSYAGHGLVGTTGATDGVHAALIGSVQPGSNAIALRGSVQPGAVGYAGIFDGDVIVNGALRVYGSPKSAAVKHPTDNSYRLLYCEESPESWFADYGKGKLVNGRAEIKLDPDFAALVHSDDYMVFPVPQGDCRGLYVADQTPAGFTVREQQGGTGNVGFAYRVVARRKDIGGERLAKVAPPPPLKPVTPFTVPETPEPKPPAKKL